MVFVSVNLRISHETYPLSWFRGILKSQQKTSVFLQKKMPKSNERSKPSKVPMETLCRLGDASARWFFFAILRQSHAASPKIIGKDWSQLFMAAKAWPLVSLNVSASSEIRKICFTLYRISDGSRLQSTFVFAVPNLLLQDLGDGSEPRVAREKKQLTKMPFWWENHLQPLLFKRCVSFRECI